MAKKRKTHRRRRKASGLSAGGRKRRRVGGGGARKGNMADVARELIGGGVGGYGSAMLYQQMSSYSPFQKLAAFGIAAYFANNAGWKNVAAGIAGGYGFAVKAGLPGMSEAEDMEEHGYADEDALSEMPDAMDEDGNPMYLMNDGNLYYAHELEEGEELEEEEEGMSAELLAHGGRGYYPDYVNASNY